jgi:ABC-2 type transport system ATP-binding protein
MTGSTVVTERLTKAYDGVKVVDRLDLDLKEGEVFGLLGPNGAGKTTTILMLLGLSEPTSGKARILGMDPAREPLDVKSRVGYLPDSVAFYEQLTGRENLRYSGRLNRIEPEALEGRIEAVLVEVGLTDAADQLAGTYSRGMLQRLGIADALLKDPSVLILDEPTTAIDPEGVREILSLIRGLADDRGVTVMLSSHLLHQVQAICDRVAIFVKGKVVASGSPHELAVGGEGPETVEVSVERPESAEAALGGAGFVQGFSHGKLPGTFTVTIERGRTADLASTLAEARLTSVRRSTDDLDDVYRRYFEKEESHV